MGAGPQGRGGKAHEQTLTQNDTAHHRTANPTLADTMHELSCELVALRQEMRGLRETVRELRDQVGDLRRQSSEKNEQVVILRTQFRVLWAVAGTAGASGLGAAALGVLRFIPGVGGAVADTAWRLLAPQQDKVADAKRNLSTQPDSSNSSNSSTACGGNTP